MVAAAKEDERELPLLAIKELIIAELVSLMNATGGVQRPKKLREALLEREKRFSMGLERGIAFPHLRTDYARSLSVGAIITDPPVPYETVDGSLVSLIVGIVTPRYDTKKYDRLVPHLMELLQYDEFVNSLKKAKNQDEVVYLFRREER